MGTPVQVIKDKTLVIPKAVCFHTHELFWMARCTYAISGHKNNKVLLVMSLCPRHSI